MTTATKSSPEKKARLILTSEQKQKLCDLLLYYDLEFWGSVSTAKRVAIIATAQLGFPVESRHVNKAAKVCKFWKNSEMTGYTRASSSFLRNATQWRRIDLSGKSLRAGTRCAALPDECAAVGYV